MIGHRVVIALFLLQALATAAQETPGPQSIPLKRQGEVLSCAGSRVRVQESKTADSLVLWLDQGSIEIRASTHPSDILLTPALRLTFVTTGELKLRLSVDPNGDTCVQNDGAGAPVIAIRDVAEANYRILPGEHVSFRHGSVREVVPHERPECGCANSGALVASAGSSIHIGATYSNANTGEVPGRIGGSSVFSTVDLLKGLGIEANVNLLNYQTPQDFAEQSYLFGLRYAPFRKQLQPYAKFLAGLGRVTAQQSYSASLPNTGKDFGVMTFGAGLDFHLNQHVILRVFDFEQQLWAGTNPSAISPRVVSVGAAYEIRLHR